MTRLEEIKKNYLLDLEAHRPMPGPEFNWLIKRMDQLEDALKEIESDEDCKTHPCPRVASRALIEEDE